MTANGQAVAVTPADTVRDRLDDPQVAASVAQIAAAAPEVRQYLSDQARHLLARADLQDIIGGCFDTAHQALVPHVHRALQDIGLLAN